MSVIRSTVIDRTPESPAPVSNDPWLNLYSGASQYRTSFIDQCYDGAGHFYVVGKFNDLSNNYWASLCITKYSAGTGDIVWQKRLPPAPAKSIQPYQIIKAVDGNFYVLSLGQFQGPVADTYSFSVIKFNSAGTILSQFFIGDPVDSNILVNTFATDSSGNLYLAGEDPNSNICVWKINAAGNSILWQKNFPRITDYLYTPYIKIGPDDQIYLAFNRYYSSPTYVSQVHFVKMGLDGSIIWQRETTADFYIDHYVYGMEISETTGNIYLLGDDYLETGYESTSITKFDSDGNLLWDRYIGHDNGATVLRSIALDNDDNIYVFVQYYAPYPLGYYSSGLITYDTDNNLLWERSLSTKSSWGQYNWFLTPAIVGDWLYFSFTYSGSYYEGNEAATYVGFFCRLYKDGTGTGTYSSTLPSIIPNFEYDPHEFVKTTAGLTTVMNTISTTSTVTAALSSSSYTLIDVDFTTDRFSLGNPPPTARFNLFYNPYQTSQYVYMSQLVYDGINFYTVIEDYMSEDKFGVAKMNSNGERIWTTWIENLGSMHLGRDGLLYSLRDKYNYPAREYGILTVISPGTGEVITQFKIEDLDKDFEPDSVAVGSLSDIYISGVNRNYSYRYLIKLDQSGTIEWYKQFYYGREGYPTAVVNAEYYGVYYAASDYNPSFGYYGIILIKFDRYGTPVWNKFLRLSSNNLVFDELFFSQVDLRLYVRAAVQYGYGSTDSVILLCFDTSGNLLWQTPGYKKLWEYGQVGVDSTGNVYLASYAYPEYSDGSAVISKFNSSGVLQGQTIVNPQAADYSVYPGSMIVTDDWLYMGAGYEFYLDNNYDDAIFIRLPKDDTMAHGWYYPSPDNLPGIIPMNYAPIDLSTTTTTNTTITITNYIPGNIGGNLQSSVSSAVYTTEADLIDVNYEPRSENWFIAQKALVDNYQSTSSYNIAISDIAVESQQGMLVYNLQNYNTVYDSYANRGSYICTVNAVGIQNNAIFFYNTTVDTPVDINSIAVDATGNNYAIINNSQGVVKQKSYYNISYQKSFSPAVTLRAIDVTAAGNAYVATSLGVVMGLGPTGTVITSRQYQGLDPCAIKVTSGNNIYVAGDYVSDGYSCSMVVKGDISGTPVWYTMLANGGLYTRDMAVGASGKAYVVGQDTGPESPGLMVYALDASGSLLWDQRIQGVNTATGVAIDIDENVYVVGSADVGTDRYLLVAKYDHLGTFLWQRQAFGTGLPPGSQFNGYSIVYNQGIVVIGGGITIPGSDNPALLVRLDAVTGEQLGEYNPDPLYLNFHPPVINYSESSYIIAPGTAEMTSVSLTVSSPSYSTANLSYSTRADDLINTTYKQQWTPVVLVDHWFSLLKIVFRWAYDDVTTFAIVTDSENNTYTVQSAGYGTPYQMIKRDAQSRMIWQKSLASPTFPNVSFLDPCMIFHGGNIYLADQIYPYYQATLIKMDTDANILWQINFVSDNYFWSCYDIRVDASGNIYLVGEGGNYGGLVYKFNSSGVLQWQTSLGTEYYASAQALDVDASGNVFVMVHDYYATMSLVKLDTSGNLLWQKNLGYMATGTDPWYYATAGLRMDSSASGFYVTFNIADGENPDYPYNLIDPGIFLGKFDLNGNVIWSRKITSPGSSQDWGPWSTKLALDASGNIYTAGYLETDTLVYQDSRSYINVLKFDPSGNLVNQRFISGSELQYTWERYVYDLAVSGDTLNIVGSWQKRYSYVQGFTFALPASGLPTGIYRGGFACTEGDLINSAYVLPSDPGIISQYAVTSYVQTVGNLELKDFFWLIMENSPAIDPGPLPSS